MREVRIAEDENDFYELSAFDSGHTWSILRCVVCQHVLFLERQWEYSHEDEFAVRNRHFHGDPRADSELAEYRAKHTSETFHPAHLMGLRAMEHSQSLPSGLRRAYEETMAAAHSGQLLLATLGLRLVIERVCHDCGVGKVPLGAMIDSLRDKGLVSTNQASFLHGVRLSGNEIAHEPGAVPTRDQLIRCFEIVNHVLWGMYHLPERSRDLDSRDNPTGA